MSDAILAREWCSESILFNKLLFQLGLVLFSLECMELKIALSMNFDFFHGTMQPITQTLHYKGLYQTPGVYKFPLWAPPGEFSLGVPNDRVEPHEEKLPAYVCCCGPPVFIEYSTCLCDIAKTTYTPKSMAASLQINIEHETESKNKAPSRTGHYGRKVTSLENVLLVINFVLEIPSAVFDQLSSVHKPQFALLSVLMSFTVLIISVIDLVYKGRQQRVSLMKKGFALWFYSPHPNSKPFGSFPDIIGLAFAFFQWAFSAITYMFVSRNADNPIKVSTLPIIFAFGLLYSKLSGNLLQIQHSLNSSKFNREEELFTLAELAAATNNFSSQRLGQGRFGTVYEGRLQDGQKVAIMRKDIGEHTNTTEDGVFESKLAYCLRLHHKNLVQLVGYCEEKTERLLVFEYVSNGTLYQELFRRDKSMIDSWYMRVKIALDVARGIDYLHNYAVPPIIHRAIKSACILLDSDWTARVAGFGLGWISLELESESISGMGEDVDPEFNGENVCSEKSDVYSFGILLLELLTGKMAVFDNGGVPVNLVEFAVSKIKGNELTLILDRRIGPPKSGNEADAVKMVADTALDSVNSEGNNKLDITRIVNKLEKALSLLK